MKILAIETSCDETGVAILECSGEVKSPHFAILGDVLLSQALKHREYGGVYPNLAKRLHAQNLVPLLKETLHQAKFLNDDSRFTIQEKVVEKILEREPELLEQFLAFIPTIAKPPIDAIAVTHGPGLEPALWVGLNFAKALSYVWDIPLIPTNHMEGHILSVLWGKQKISNDKFLIPKIEFPAIALLISGGHTELVLVTDWMKYELIGQTRDDAVGEAFDKVARLLELPYPGGPEISKLAERARTRPKDFYTKTLAEYGIETIDLPRPMVGSPDYDFSFSGLKTAVLYLVKKLGILSPEMKELIAQAFEQAVIDVLVYKTRKALEAYGSQTLIIGGGVIASTAIREAFEKLMQDTAIQGQLYIPEQKLTTDNAVMIGMAGYIRICAHPKTYGAFTPDGDIRAQGTLRLHNEQTSKEN